METRLNEDPVSLDARWDVVNRILCSSGFQRSPRLRELFRYICQKAAENRPDELREQLIGQRVFGRKADYSPGEDNIVRVEVRHLRKRLEDYFSAEGKDEPLVIVIPKGTYVPAFEARATPAPALTPNLSLTESTRVFRRAPVIIVAILALTCIWLWQRERYAQRQLDAIGKSDSQRSPLWRLLFNGDRTTLVVCADSSLVAAQTILHHTLSLEEYLARDYGAADKVSPDARSILHSLPLWQFTDIADVRLVQSLYRLNANHWDKVSVRSAKTTQIQDFKNGNVVLLGSVRSNPWDRLLEPMLNFHFDFDEQDHLAFIRNRAPLAGEQPVYRAAKPGDSGEAYSTIALVPNLRHTGSVLVIAGTTGESTEAAGEFIMNREASAGFVETLLYRNHNRLPYFEVLLQSRTLAGVARNPEIVAIRILSDPIAGAEAWTSGAENRP